MARPNEPKDGSPAGCIAPCGGANWRQTRWRLRCGCVPDEGDQDEGATEAEGRGPDRQFREHRTRGVGPHRGRGSHGTLERTSGRLRVRTSQGWSRSAAHPPARDHRAGGRTGARLPGLVRRPHSDIVDMASTSTSIATAAPASSIGPGLTVPGLSPSGVSAHTELLTPAAPAAAQRSHEKGKATRRSSAVAAAGSQSNGADKTLENSSESAKAGVAAANTALQPSPNVTVGNGNGNANANANGNNGNANANGNGHADNGHADNGHANGHTSGPPVTSQAPAPPPPAPPVPSHGIGAGQPPGRGAGAGHSH